MSKELIAQEIIENIDPFQLLKKDMLSYPILEPEEEKLLYKEYDFAKKCKLKLNDYLEKQNPVDDVLLEFITIGIKAREKLINSNLRLVMSSAIYFSGIGDDGVKIKDDIVHNFFSGCEGLIKGVEKFDPEKGRLSTYARPKIIKAITENLRWNNIYAPRWVRELTKKYLKISEEYMILNGKEPTDDYILEKLQISQKKLEMIRIAYSLNKVVSFDKTDDDSDDTQLEHLSINSYYSNMFEDYRGFARPTEENVINNVSLSELDIQIYETLKSSINNEVQMKIVTQIFILGETNETEIARSCNVSPQYVNAEKKRLLKILEKDPVFLSFCLDYLGVRK